MTLAILYTMKLVVFVVRLLGGSRKRWGETTGFDEDYCLDDRLQATIQQEWREHVDATGRPILTGIPLPDEEKPPVTPHVSSEPPQIPASLTEQS